MKALAVIFALWCAINVLFVLLMWRHERAKHRRRVQAWHQSATTYQRSANT